MDVYYHINFSSLSSVVQKLDGVCKIECDLIRAPLNRIKKFYCVPVTLYGRGGGAGAGGLEISAPLFP